MRSRTWYTGTPREHLITVVDRRPTMITSKDLVTLGVPLKTALRWRQERRDMTLGLRRRVAEAHN